MTSFKISNDDSAVRSIQATNKTPVTASSPVTPVKASKPVQVSPENLPLKTTKVDQRNSEAQNIPRKKIDRRKNDSPVLLDTRNNHERRIKTERKDGKDTPQDANTLRGIDELV